MTQYTNIQLTPIKKSIYNIRLNHQLKKTYLLQERTDRGINQTICWLTLIQKKNHHQQDILLSIPVLLKKILTNYFS